MKKLKLLLDVMRGGCRWLVVAMVVVGAGAMMPNAHGQGATGGTITQDGSVYIHTFTNSASAENFVITHPVGIQNVEILVVGGGGAGGGSINTAAGGGGGGGGDFVTNSYASLEPQTITVTVGRGGTGGTSVGEKGVESSVVITAPSTTITAPGGGGGGGRSGNTTTAPTTGGSSGGAAYNAPVGTGTSPAGTGINVNKGGNSELLIPSDGQIFHNELTVNALRCDIWFC